MLLAETAILARRVPPSPPARIVRRIFGTPTDLPDNTRQNHLDKILLRTLTLATAEKLQETKRFMNQVTHIRKNQDCNGIKLRQEIWMRCYKTFAVEIQHNRPT